MSILLNRKSSVRATPCTRSPADAVQPLRRAFGAAAGRRGLHAGPHAGSPMRTPPRSMPMLHLRSCLRGNGFRAALASGITSAHGSRYPVQPRVPVLPLRLRRTCRCLDGANLPRSTHRHMECPAPGGGLLLHMSPPKMSAPGSPGRSDTAARFLERSVARWPDNTPDTDSSTPCHVMFRVRRSSFINGACQLLSQCDISEPRAVGAHRNHHPPSHIYMVNRPQPE